MVGFAIVVLLCQGLVQRDGGGATIFASATVPPSGAPSASWRSPDGMGYRRDDDIPVMGDRARRLPKNDDDSGGRSKGERRRQRSRRSRRRQDGSDGADARDSSDDDGNLPFFFMDRGHEDDEWTEHRRRRRRRQTSDNKHLDSIRRWTMEKTGVYIPRINVHFDPITILKIRKSWPNIIPGAVVRVGADLETHRLGRGLWRIRGCVEDKLLGGRFTIRERKNGDDRSVLLEYSKSWLFAGGGTSGTRLNLSAAYDVSSQRCSARFGFKTENTNGQPLESDRKVLLEARTRVELPEPEFVIGTDFDAESASVGIMGIEGDVGVDVEEVNLIFLF